MFKKTSHLSEILEESEKNPVIIFKYSNKCGSSDVLKSELEEKIRDKKIANPVYIVVVQEMPVLSRNLEEVFDVKHESPQIIIINNGKVTYSAHHYNIKVESFSYSIS